MIMIIYKQRNLQTQPPCRYCQPNFHKQTVTLTSVAVTRQLETFKHYFRILSGVLIWRDLTKNLLPFQLLPPAIYHRRWKQVAASCGLRQSVIGLTGIASSRSSWSSHRVSARARRGLCSVRSLIVQFSLVQYTAPIYVTEFGQVHSRLRSRQPKTQRRPCATQGLIFRLLINPTDKEKTERSAIAQ